MDKQSVILQCSCGVHAIRIEKQTYNDGEDCDYNISCLIDRFYADKLSLWGRIKLIWKVLRRGDHWLFDIEVNQEDIDKLHEKLHEFKKAD